MHWEYTHREMWRTRQLKKQKRQNMQMSTFEGWKGEEEGKEGDFLREVTFCPDFPKQDKRKMENITHICHFHSQANWLTETNLPVSLSVKLCFHCCCCCWHRQCPLSHTRSHSLSLSLSLSLSFCPVHSNGRNINYRIRRNNWLAGWKWEVAKTEKCKSVGHFLLSLSLSHFLIFKEKERKRMATLMANGKWNWQTCLHWEYCLLLLY